MNSNDQEAEDASISDKQAPKKALTVEIRDIERHNTLLKDKVGK